MQERKQPESGEKNCLGQKSMKVKKKRQEKRRVETAGISIDGVRKFDKRYLNGPVSIGSAKRLPNLNKLSLKKLKCIWKRNHLSPNDVHVASGFQGLKLLLTT